MLEPLTLISRLLSEWVLRREKGRHEGNGRFTVIGLVGLGFGF
jgi:hypothetical protein